MISVCELKLIELIIKFFTKNKLMHDKRLDILVGCVAFFYKNVSKYFNSTLKLIEIV
jgi:hypothetical protein